MLRSVVCWFSCLLASASASAMQGMDHSMHGAIHNMKVTDTGVVMNENRDRLPRGCDAISVEHEFTVYAGREYASNAPGTMFGMDKNEWRVEPCSMITVTFVNKDEIRHQWMVHGLPKYLYSTGMFHIEAMGGQTQTGTFIVPGEDRNYLVHCDMAQHMEKGMRAQLVVGSGGGDLWGVPGISDAFYRFSYLPAKSVQLAMGALIAAFIATMLWLRSRPKS
jgi:plastocyanin